MSPDQSEAGRPVEGVPSTAAIGGHPIHPMLISFPIAFLTGALGTDIAYLRTRDPFWARASVWLLRAGLASGVSAGAFGAADLVTIRKARSSAVGMIHGVGNSAALALAYMNVRRRRGRREDAISAGGLALSAAVASILGVTGWLGGELSYRHGIGVVGQGDGKKPGPQRHRPRHPRHGRAGLHGHSYETRIHADH